MQQINNQLYQFNFPEFGSFVYLYPQAKIIIDTSSTINKKFLIKELQRLDLQPEDIKYVFLTHTHYDHCGNIDLFPNAKIITSLENEEILKKGDDQIMSFATRGDIPPSCDNLSFSQTILENWQIISTPGHVVGSVCFFNQQDNVLFSGDSIFAHGILPRTDFVGSDIEQLKESYRQLQSMNLQVETLCPGHGKIQLMTNFKGYLEDLEKVLKVI